ncbi:uncharacterized protein LOC116177752 [Photinus pyralis]|uniref:uncharacterized protein LOC116177752 n=1 Tax=Photinus pyralis TaxID=7054 RepID=UPI001267535B|nr:uncharacterized protein LOC116177752 [Photinus pyralis]
MGIVIQSFVLITVVFSVAHSRRCFKCESEKTFGCAKEAKPNSVECGREEPGFTTFCSYRLFHHVERKVNISKSDCLQVKEGSILDRIVVPDCKNPPPGHNVIECKVCASELCNSAPLLSTSLLNLLPLFFLVKYLAR